MSWTDPGIELVSCGETGWSDWDRVVLEGLAEFVRYHSVHIYTGSDDYWTNVLVPHQAERAIRITGALIEQVRYNQKIKHPISIAYDEWNVWFRERDGPGLEERYTLADALAVTTFLHGFLRHSSLVPIANLAQLVNVIAPIVTSQDGLFLQTIYHPLRLFADHLGEQALDVFTSCDTHELTQPAETESWPHQVADLGPFPVLDAAATYSPDRREVMLSVINRDPSTRSGPNCSWPRPWRRSPSPWRKSTVTAWASPTHSRRRRRSPFRPARLRSSRLAPPTRSRPTPSPC